MSIICKLNKIQQSSTTQLISNTFISSQIKFKISKNLYSTEAQENDSIKPEKTERVFFSDQEVIDGFKLFDVYMKKKREFLAFEFKMKKPYKRVEKDKFARCEKMSVDQDWTNAWPTSSMFKQSGVPLPVRQGYVKNLTENQGLPPEKYGNTELMKIPNFLHLTPPHIKKQCAAIKKFCTPWPAELKTDQDCEKFFPIETTISNYIYDGPSIRDDRARVVTLKIKVKSLNLDERAYDKFIKLAQHRYDPKTDILTLVADRCPYRRQNEEYANYLLTTLYFESKQIEDWESEMTEDDMREFKWEKSRSKENILNTVASVEKLNDVNKVINLEKVENYKKNLTNIFNEGETDINLSQYKKSVLNLLKLDSANLA